MADPAALYEQSCHDVSYEVTKTILVKVSSALSIFGSSRILVLVGRAWRANRARVNPYQRIMAVYSVYDLFLSFFLFFLGPWMVPAATGYWSAAGNAATCSVQGFSLSFGGIGSTLCQVMLSLQMMLQVVYNWKDDKFERRIEYRMHASILVLSFAAALVPLFFQGYNPSCGACGNPIPLPNPCGDWIFGDGTTECLRGSATLSNIYLAILFLSVGGAAVFCTGAMIIIYWRVYKQEQVMAQYRRGGTQMEIHATSRSIQKKMLMYTSTFYTCWILPAVFMYLPGVPTALNLAGHVLAPLMGFLNMLVFILPKCVKYQREHAGTRLLAAYYHVLFDATSARIRASIRRDRATTWQFLVLGHGAPDHGAVERRGQTDNANVERGVHPEPAAGPARDSEAAGIGDKGEQSDSSSDVESQLAGETTDLA